MAPNHGCDNWSPLRRVRCRQVTLESKRINVITEEVEPEPSVSTHVSSKRGMQLCQLIRHSFFRI